MNHNTNSSFDHSDIDNFGPTFVNNWLFASTYRKCFKIKKNCNNS